jgi:hypothetical protein
MSFDSRESSNDLSVRGFCGMSHAVTIVVDAGTSVPASRGTPFDVVFCRGPQAAAARIRTATRNLVALK